MSCFCGGASWCVVVIMVAGVVMAVVGELLWSVVVVVSELLV